MLAPGSGPNRPVRALIYHVLCRWSCLTLSATLEFTSTSSPPPTVHLQEPSKALLPSPPCPAHGVDAGGIFSRHRPGLLPHPAEGIRLPIKSMVRTAAQETQACASSSPSPTFFPPPLPPLPSFLPPASLNVLLPDHPIPLVQHPLQLIFCATASETFPFSLSPLPSPDQVSAGGNQGVGRAASLPEATGGWGGGENPFPCCEN